ncbi:MAG: phenylalanine-4-hydroxylase [Francisella sp.]|jgi:phenylalanine-4-hydroxylase
MKKPSKYISRKPDSDGYITYPANENKVWQDLSEKQIRIVKDYACDEYLEGLDYLGLSINEIPQLPIVNKKLQQATGWAVEPVPALIGFDRFFKLLSERKFPCATFIRTQEDFNYVTEPDIFHEIFGHTPMLAYPIYAGFMQKYGELGIGQEPFVQKMLARFYWFTVEFGLIQTKKGLKAYGGGILSSPGETLHAIDELSVVRKPFNALNILRTPYRIDILQPIYYVIESYEQIYDVLNNDFIKTIMQAKEMGEFKPLYT